MLGQLLRSAVRSAKNKNKNNLRGRAAARWPLGQEALFEGAQAGTPGPGIRCTCCVGHEGVNTVRRGYKLIIIE